MIEIDNVLGRINHPTQIVIGNEIDFPFEQILDEERICLITSRGATKRTPTLRFIESLKKYKVHICDEITPYMDVSEFSKLAVKLNKNKFDTYIALGGGSVIDAAKVLSYMKAHNTFDANFLVGKAKDRNLAQRISTKIIAVPTTSGSGSEVTNFATIWDFKNYKKYSLIHKDLYPTIAFLNPQLTETLSHDKTVASAWDAVSHSLDSLWNKNSSEESSYISRMALKYALKANLEVCKKPSEDQRINLMMSSLLAGISISITKTSIAHAISYPLTLNYRLDHGIACSFTLSSILKVDSIANSEKFTNISKELGLNNALELSALIDFRYESSGAKELLRKSIPTQDLIESITSQMCNEDRIDNSILSIDSLLIQKIVKESCSTIYKGYY